MKTEEKTLEYYKTRRAGLLRELDLLDNLIKLMDTRMMIYGDVEKPNFVTLENNTVVLESSTTDNNRHKILFDFKSHNEDYEKVISMGTSYNKAMTYNEKILFVLKKLKSATIYEMVECLSAYQPISDDVERKKLFSGLTMAASALNVRKEIHSYKVGKRNRYSLTASKSAIEQLDLMDVENRKVNKKASD